MIKDIFTGGTGETSSIGDRIKLVRRQNKMTQKTFAESIGIVQGFLCAIERGKKTPSDTLLIALQHQYCISQEWLTEGSGPMERSGHPVQPQQGRNMPMAPFYGNSTTIPLDTSQIQASTAHISLPGLPENCFALKYTGDYMSPTIRDGDIVIIMPGKEPVPGEIALISGKWGEAFLRRYRFKDGDFFFTADNSSYNPFRHDDSTRILGVVVTVWRNIKI